MRYETGVASKDAKKALKNGPERNPEGALDQDWKYPYFHFNYCTTKGHTYFRLVYCCMHGKDKIERDEAVKAVELEATAFEMDAMANDGNY